ncbi:MAG TPA: putative sugar nucleotidyl transferase [Gemmatimonadales bacterium]|nr:putative sugar nucleotidyl transferase [Gemmatimonadales bacterium]
MSLSLVLLEPAAPGVAWAPFTGVRPVSELRAGIWKIRERWEAALDLDAVAIVGSHIAGFYEGFEPPCRTELPKQGPLFVASASFAPTGAPITLEPETRRLTHQGQSVAWIVEDRGRWAGPTDEGPAQAVEGLALRGTYDLVTALDRFLAADCLAFGSAPADPVPAGSVVIGDPGLVLCRGALVEPGVVFDTRAGAVVLEAGVEVRHGARLEGPLYAGERSRVLGGHARASVFGPRSNLNGEISNSVFLGYANKSHDGFLGHSVLGHWVNLGAGTTTSNLKNTYGAVILQVAGERIATGRQFLGSLIGDHAKTSIGTLLSTGTVIGAGANVFGEMQPPKFIPPLSWGSTGEEQVTEEGFIKVAERVMPRRDVALTPERLASLTATYRRLTSP